MTDRSYSQRCESCEKTFSAAASFCPFCGEEQGGDQQ